MRIIGNGLDFAQGRERGILCRIEGSSLVFAGEDEVVAIGGMRPGLEREVLFVVAVYMFLFMEASAGGY